jgi:tetratricopeptide (TPR) repeat protein
LKNPFVRAAIPIWAVIPYLRESVVCISAPCAPHIKNVDYPQWLKLGLAALLVLLFVALIHGRKYFHAGSEMYIGEHLVEQAKYADAIPHLAETLKIAPNSDKAALLAAKAALLSGDLRTAGSALHGHQNGYFDDANDPQFKEVNGLWNHATAAMDKAERAGKLEEQEGQEVAAAKLMHEAAAEYPQLPDLALAAEMYDGGVDFARANYDGYLAMGEKVWARQRDANSAAVLASGLACKYAVTGDGAYRQRATEMLETARRLAESNPEIMKNLSEYFPRIQHRLSTRQIITKQEYDRRFAKSGGSSK